ncbi:pantoate--beta-alanine ligase [Candidatus Methylomirabilis lanthanidiphila]|uniref:Pantothenate synthetase n=1 Tax=Candidatus Methylomirabilis lanthanidiphila TaxID=2211376 RepID=A0A564ZGB3_9BACT|nr:pantoate--beta-alanine ligase [Candidatus Methylomirabilis lanthanidiphila]VUZ84166.1 pantoate--beta-alanine ligase [Candidatus Methylomirabilis lanthanidiphila]
MQTIDDPSAIQRRCESLRRDGKTIGLVPTMGAFHEGHVSLMRWARADNDILVVSVFVNPIQFGRGEDFDSYPRDLDGDLAQAEQAGVDLVFAPSAEAIYPKGFQTYVDVTEVTKGLCGASRPGHFRGVTTVVAKLFNLIGPHRAYFGQKDYQQSVVVRRLVADLNMALDIVLLPTVREADGLAMSSRNIRLTPPQRRAASVLYASLSRAETRIRDGERNAATIFEDVRAMIETEPLARIDYVAVCDPETLQPLDCIEGPALVALAVRFGETRLIDNFLITAS